MEMPSFIRPKYPALLVAGLNIIFCVRIPRFRRRNDRRRENSIDQTGLLLQIDIQAQPMRDIKNPIAGSSNAALLRIERRSSHGFTLLELLVVFAIIAILASLLLPALGRAKDHARMTTCLSSLRQIYVAMKIYMQDYSDRYPTTSGNNWVSFRLGGGNPDPSAAARFGLEWATNRILWPYTKSRELYRCPSDRGMDDSPWMAPFNSCYEELGCSYKYNDDLWHGQARLAMADPDNGLAGKREDWVPSPSRYILLHEPPASPDNVAGWAYFFWHYARGKSTVFSLTQVQSRFISPVLFVDGHAAKHDFTQQIESSSEWPAEPMPDWIW